MTDAAAPLEWVRLGIASLGAVVSLFALADAVQDFVVSRQQPQPLRCFVAKVWVGIQSGLLGLQGIIIAREWALLQLPPTVITAQPDRIEAYTVILVMALQPVGLAIMTLSIVWARHHLNNLVRRILARQIVRVLVIDDDPAMRAMMTTVLEGEGYYVQALEVQDSLALVATWPPDVAVVDLMMPEMDGVEAIRRIRAVSPSVRVILYSAKTTGAIEHGAALAGADAVLGKPFDIDALLRLVRGDEA